MSQPVLLKVYGNLWPAPTGLYMELAKIASQALPDGADICQKNDLLTISFEGVYFPLEETLSALGCVLRGNEKGKLDAIDIESWKMTRYLVADGQIIRHDAPLNDVLAWSGH